MTAIRRATLTAVATLAALLTGGALSGGGAAWGAGSGSEGFEKAFVASALTSFPALLLAAGVAPEPVLALPMFAALQGISAAAAATRSR